MAKSVSKVTLGGLVLVLVSFMLLELQQFTGYFEFIDVIGSRGFVILCNLGVALGCALLLRNIWLVWWKWFALIAIVLFGFIFIGGWGYSLADALGVDVQTDASSAFFILDAMSSQIANSAIIVNMITKSIVPCVVIIVGIVMFLMAKDVNEYQTALLECGVCVAMLIAFGLLQKFLF